MNWLMTANCAEYEGANWDNWIVTKHFASVKEAEAFGASLPQVSFFFYCRQGMSLTNGRNFLPGDAAFFSGQPWIGSAPQCDTYRKISYDTPSFIHDFPVGSSQDVSVCSQWNLNIDGFTKQAILGNPWTSLFASNQTNYFDTADVAIPSTAAAAIVSWTAFPNRLSQYLGAGSFPANPNNYDKKQLLAIADQFAPAGSVAKFTNIPTVLCPQADWTKPLHMYGPYGPRGWQDEYCEWSVVRDPKSQKITRIDFTCENPEYWNTLWMTSPERVAELYAETLNWDAPGSQMIKVEVTDLYLIDPVTKAVVTDPSTGRPAYNPLNRWNSGPIAVRGSTQNLGGAMHLTSTPNTLQTEMQLAGGATIQRPGGNSQPQSLICCAQYGQAYRNSDPHIGQSVNQVVGGQLTGTPSNVALANPTGLYIQVPDLSTFTLPADPKLPKGATAQDCWQIVRGSASLVDPVTNLPFGATAPGQPTTGNFVLHAVFQIPSAWVAAGVQFTVGDIKDGSGEPIQWGGQVAQMMHIGLWARPIPILNTPAAQQCVLPPPTGITPPPAPVPPSDPQPLQLFHQSVWNAYYGTSVPNPMNTPIKLASNSTLIAPIVRLGQKDIRMSLTCSISTPVTPDKLPQVDVGPDITVTTLSYDDSIDYAVPGNSYPSGCGVLTLSVTVSPSAQLGLRGLGLRTNGGPTPIPMPGLLNVASPV